MTTAGPAPAQNLALEALAFARHAIGATTDTVTISMPGVKLTAATRSPTYRRALQTALIDNPAYAGMKQDSVLTVVADRRTYPDAPQWAPDADITAIAVAGDKSGMFFAHQGDFNQWQFFDPKALLGVQLMPHSDSYPHWEDSFPLLQFLHWVTMMQGRRIVHAASLGLDGRGVLIAGSSGAGKSGTTLAGVLNGLQSIGDDYVLVEPREDGVFAYPLTRIMKQDVRGLVRNGAETDRRFRGPNWQGKHEAYLSDLMGEEIPVSFELRAILLPRVSGETRILPARGVDAMTAMLPSNVVQLFGGRKYAVSFLSDLVRRLPVYRLELGANPREIAAVISELLVRGGG